MPKMKKTATIHSSPAQPYDSKISGGASKGKSNTAGRKTMKTKGMRK